MGENQLRRHNIFKKSWQKYPKQTCHSEIERIDRVLNIFIGFLPYILYKSLRYSISLTMRFKQYITLLLCMVLMLMLSMMPLSLASHSIDHHHHSAQTHTTGICAWMCTAAQTISTDSQILSPNFLLLEIIPSSSHFSVPVPPQFFFPSRAPPFLILFSV